MKTNCHTCGKEIDRKPSQLKKYKPYCSQSCRKKSMEKGSMVECVTCGKLVRRTPSEIKKSKSGNIFCSHSCSAQYSNKHRSEHRWDYRKFAFEHLEHKCALCGYNKVVDILQVHHISRDRKDNSIENLQILCPNCHSEVHYKANDGVFWNKKPK